VQSARIARERITIETMIMLYCEAKHQTDRALCADCQELLEYAMHRLRHCKFGEYKPVCAKCPIHCYRKDMRGQVIQVMRFSGPRMIYKHPKLALLHMIDSLKGYFAKK
jgi:hypothetical protein